MRKQLNIGLFGFGCVGQGLHDVLARSPSANAHIRKICIRDPRKPRSLPAAHFTTDADALLNDPDLNVIVELIDDDEAAYAIVTRALRAGKAVVTANKKMLAAHFPELLRLQQETGTPLLYEGACCASIPVIRNLEEYYDNDFLRSISGIFNGSTNYILTRIFESGSDYAATLAQAQALGFAETDPTLDVEGHDPRYKLAILIAHAYGVWVPPEALLLRGISQVGWQEVRYAREKGWRLRLVARAARKGKRLYAGVLPEFVREGDPLYPVRLEDNAVLLESAFADVQLLRGKGAGGWPTGAAVLSDISALGYGYRYAYRKAEAAPDLALAGDAVLPIYLRYADPLSLGTIELESVAERFSGYGYHYLTGEIRLEKLQAYLQTAEASEIFVARLPEGVLESAENEHFQQGAYDHDDQENARELAHA